MPQHPYRSITADMVLIAFLVLTMRPAFTKQRVVKALCVTPSALSKRMAKASGVSRSTRTRPILGRDELAPAVVETEEPAPAVAHIVPQLPENQEELGEQRDVADADLVERGGEHEGAEYKYGGGGESDVVANVKLYPSITESYQRTISFPARLQRLLGLLLRLHQLCLLLRLLVGVDGAQELIELVGVQRLRAGEVRCIAAAVGVPVICREEGRELVDKCHQGDGIRVDRLAHRLAHFAGFSV